MKLRIANIGIPVAHETITNLPLRSPSSLSDFDALIFNPQAVGGALSSDIYELSLKEGQVQDLIKTKAGVVFVMLTPAQGVTNTGGRILDPYYLLDGLVGRRIGLDLRPGSGTSLKLAPTASSAGRRYFHALEGHLQFECFLVAVADSARVIAHDSVGHFIAAQYNAGNGKIILLPPPTGVTPERFAAAIVETVSSLLKDDSEISEPAWASAIMIPGSNSQDARITELRNKRRDLKEELRELEAGRTKLLSFKHLLYGTGKAALETAVRSAFRLLQFEVPEPEEYSGEWDFELRLQDGRTTIGEVEGAEGVVSVDKFRQLHHYLGEEELAGRSHKGILVGNGFRQQEPELRRPQFSEHTINAALKFGVCLLPATELFKSAMFVLENQEDHGLRREIRESLLSTVGPWVFVKPRSPAADPIGVDEPATSETTG